MTATVTEPGWLGYLVARLGGEPESSVTHGDGGRVRHSYVWPSDPGTMGVAVVSHGARVETYAWKHDPDYPSATLNLPNEPTDAQVLYLLRAVGVLPEMVQAVDRDGESFWFTAEGETFWRRYADKVRPGDRPLWVEAVPEC